MNGQMIHVWVAALCFGVAVLGMSSMWIGFILPVRSKVGSRLFSIGMASTVTAVVVYLIYAVASVVAMAVVRS